MKSEDRKLAYAFAIPLAVLAFAALWFLFIGPTDGSPNYTANCKEDCDLPWWWSATFWTVAFTAILTSSSVAMWYETRRLAKVAEAQSHDMKASIAVAQTAADAAIAAHRPWIDFEFTAVEPLVFDAKGCRGSFRVTPTNIGNTPAVQVRESVIMTVLTTKDPFERGFDRLAKRQSKLGIGIADGHTLFPKEKRGGLTYRVEIDQSEIEDVIADPNSKGLIEFHAIVSVDYKFSGGVGNTTRNYFVWTHGTDEFGRWSKLDPKKGSYEVEDIAITAIPAKNSAT